MSYSKLGTNKISQKLQSIINQSDISNMVNYSNDSPTKFNRFCVPKITSVRLKKIEDIQFNSISGISGCQSAKKEQASDSIVYYKDRKSNSSDFKKNMLRGNNEEPSYLKACNSTTLVSSPICPKKVGERASLKNFCLRKHG